MTRQKPTLIFLIRLWQAENGDEPAWRASVESAAGNERRAFTSLEDLFSFLRQETLQAMRPTEEDKKET